MVTGIISETVAFSFAFSSSSFFCSVEKTKKRPIAYVTEKEGTGHFLFRCPKMRNPK